MGRFLLWALALSLGALLLLGVAIAVLGSGWLGVRQQGGEPVASRIPASVVAERAAQRSRAFAERDKQILFGDLHVHTTFSFDAFIMSLPIFQGEGAHPPADACDFARYCSALDFWSINDHAEGLTTHQWKETKRAVRQCQDLAGDSDSPDLVSFLGWEWTQIGMTPETHYGHKNVLIRDLEEGSIPARPIASARQLVSEEGGAPRIGPALRSLLIATSPGSDDRQAYHDFARFLQDRDDAEFCADGVPVRELPADCLESAANPTTLFSKLDDWGFPYLVIPHGNTWGIYTPPGTSWDKQLAAHEDPGRHEFLMEVFSGHGNAEEYRPWRGVERGPDGRFRCPEPRPGYLPACWRAGEIVEERCLAVGETEEECDTRTRQARQHYAKAGSQGHVTVPGARAEDWLDSGQCTDCFMPTYSHRPGGSAQYALAISDFRDDSESPKRFQFGLIGSSDSHTARPGTGFKELNRREMTEANEAGFGGSVSGLVEPEPRSIPLEEAMIRVPEFERFASFLGTGGLAAVHSEGRSREEIWHALQRKEVYATSGERILLWFDLVAGDEELLPMGSQAAGIGVPRFRVRAVGAFRQKPGCPEYSVSALSPERLHHLCRGECYNPSDERKRIARIEVVRIRPQAEAGESVEGLIEDPWLVLPCEAAGGSCSVEFEDPEYRGARRDTLYYVRAMQEPSPAINADSLRCERDESGRCIESRPCYGDPRTEYEDDCLGEAEERAWSSPIFLRYSATPELHAVVR